MNSQQLYDELVAQADRREDYIVDVGKLEMTSDGEIALEGNGYMLPTKTSQEQAAIFLGIPNGYWNRLREEQPDLLAQNFNGRVQRHKGTRRFVRTFASEKDDGLATMRAMLSPRYRVLDNLDLLGKSHPVFQEKGVVPFRAHLTDDRMSLTLTSKEIGATLDVADIGAGNSNHIIAKTHTLTAALTMGNSETGMGGLNIGIAVVVNACTNLYIGLDTFRKVHIGREIIGDGLLASITSDETRQAEDAAVWGKVQDMIRATFTQEIFEGMVDNFRRAREVELTEPIQTIKLIANREQINEDVLLASFMAEPEPTGFGVTQALTLAAQDKRVGQDDQIRLSRLAGKALAGGEDDWKRLIAAPVKAGATVVEADAN